MLKKIRDYLPLFTMCLCALILMAFGIMVLYYALYFLVSIIMTPWLCVVLIVGFTVGWSIALYKNLSSELHLETAGALCWHIIYLGEPLTWGSGTLEFLTKKSANEFLADLTEIDSDYFGCYVTESLCIADESTIDATKLKPIYEKDSNSFYLEER